MTHRLLTSCVALSTAMATPTLADVTAADVWSNQQALYSSIGISISGDVSGDMLMNPEMNIVLPGGVASMQITGDDISMVSNGDGTVTISYPSPMTMTFAGGAEGEGSFSATAVMTHDSYTVIASGDPGDISYASNGQNLRFEITDVSTDAPEGINMAIEGFLTLTDWVGTSRVTEGNLITYTAENTTGESVADFTVSGEGVLSRSQQTSLPITSSVQASMPVGGSDVMNLSNALRNGLTVVIESMSEGSSSSAEVTLDGELLNRQTTVLGPQTATIAFDEAGLRMASEANGFDLVMNDPLIFPADLEFGMETVSADLDIPLNASEEPQDFRMAMSFQGVTLGETIWNLFDPAAQLPRDPAEVTFDVTGMGTNGMDLLDFAAMADLFGPPPIEVDEVTIENLRIALAGAEATATGSMTFDWTDFETIPGIARPEGQVTVNLNGANRLMDNLVAMGLIPEEELMMPRMMMGMFATPVGDDQLESVLEINEQGHILANGQRLQ